MMLAYPYVNSAPPLIRRKSRSRFIAHILGALFAEFLRGAFGGDRL